MPDKDPSHSGHMREQREQKASESSTQPANNSGPATVASAGFQVIIKEQTFIEHPDGSVTVVRTDERGDHYITRHDHQEHQVGTSGGEARSHRDVVREVAREGDKLTHEKDPRR